MFAVFQTNENAFSEQKVPNFINFITNYYIALNHSHNMKCSLPSYIIIHAETMSRRVSSFSAKCRTLFQNTSRPVHMSVSMAYNPQALKCWQRPVKTLFLKKSISLSVVKNNVSGKFSNFL